jgi:replicative DNA helicase
VLPHDIEAERALLGSMLQDRAAIAETLAVLGDVGSAVFSREKHQQLYDVLVQMYAADQATDDAVVLENELTRRGLWEPLGKFDFLATLVTAVPSSLRVRHYAEIVRDKYLLRELIGANHEVMQTAFDAALPAREILDMAEKRIFEVTERRVSGEAQSLAELVREAFKTIERRGNESLTGEPTGYTDLDDMTCGLQPGELIIVAGRPSMGKTAFGLNMAEHLSIVERRPALFFSLEMSRQQIAQRILCSRARVDSHRLRRGRHSHADLQRLTEVAQELSGAPLLVDDTSDLTILELRARARMAFRRHSVAAIYVDYLQLMRVPGSESRQVEVSLISRGLKALAKDLRVPVIAMAQLNRATEDKTRKGNRPRMSDLRESGAIEQDADVIMLLHRESYYRSGEDADAADDNTAEVIIAKQRNGPTGEIKLTFNRQYTRFDNWMPESAAPIYVPRANDAAPF